MKKAFILIFSLLLAAAFVLSASAIESDPYFGGGGAFPEYGEENSPFDEYYGEFTYPNMDDKMNDGVYTYGYDEYDDYFDGYDDEDSEILNKMEDISATFAVVGVLVSAALIVLLIIFAVKVSRSSKKLKRYREIECSANPGVMYYDPTGKIAPTPDFAARQNGSYGYPNGYPNNSPFGYRENDFDYQNGGFNGQNNGFNNQNGNNGVNGGDGGE